MVMKNRYMTMKNSILIPVQLAEYLDNILLTNTPNETKEINLTSEEPQQEYQIAAEKDIKYESKSTEKPFWVRNQRNIHFNYGSKNTTRILFYSKIM